MIYKNTKTVLCSHDGDILCTNERKWFQTKKVRSRRHTSETNTTADYTVDLMLLANTSAQPESLLYSLEHAARSIGF